MLKAGAWLGPLIVLWAAPAAQAASVGTVTSTLDEWAPYATLQYTGSYGAEDLTVSQSPTTVTFRAKGGVIIDDSDLCARDGLALTCTAPDGRELLANADGGPGDDRLEVIAGSAGLAGGAGADLLIGGGVLQGGDGNDILRGRAGNDQLYGGPGADDMAGGAGVDTVHYDDHHTSVNVYLDDHIGDGSPGEWDYVRPDVENVQGSLAGGDVIVGDGGPNRITASAHGGPPSTVYGSGGDDWLWGAGTFDGGFGNDQLFFPFSDSGPGDMRGGPGDDALWTNNHVTDVAVDCGDGTDTATVDVADPRTDCETVAEH